MVVDNEFACFSFAPPAFGSSLKGEAGIDWDDLEARQAFLEGVVADADRLLTVAREAMERFPAGDPERRRLHEAAVLLERLLMQDIERREDGTRLKQGVSPDRVVSVHDPEMRHGRKSERRRFDGLRIHQLTLVGGTFSSPIGMFVQTQPPLISVNLSQSPGDLPVLTSQLALRVPPQHHLSVPTHFPRVISSHTFSQNPTMPLRTQHQERIRCRVKASG